MRERPIIFSAPMVQAILEGRKTQTRRVLHREKLYNGYAFDDPRIARACPHGQPGDRLWARETFAVITGVGRAPHVDDAVEYRADNSPAGEVIGHARAWRPSIFMPRAYSRITLEVVGVRVERVQDISEADARAEGADQEFRTVVYSPAGVKDYHMPVSYRGGFANLWDSINETRGYGWDTNPWVWVVEFKRI